MFETYEDMLEALLEQGRLNALHQVQGGLIDDTQNPRDLYAEMGIHPATPVDTALSHIGVGGHQITAGHDERLDYHSDDVASGW